MNVLIRFFTLFVFLFYGGVTLAENKPLVVVLDWYINPNHAPLLVAEQQHFFAKHGVKITIISPSDPSDGPKFVAAEKADIAITYQPGFMLQVNEGLPLLRVGTLVNQPLDCLLTLEQSGINQVGDLKGKMVGYSSAGLGHLMLKTMARYHHFSLHDIELVNVKYGLTQALLAGKISGFTGAMRNFEPFQLQLAGKPGHVFYPEDNGYPSYDELIFVINKKNRQDPRIRSFLLAVQDGVKYLKQHPKETWDRVKNDHPELNNELNHLAWKASIPYFADKPMALDKEKYQNFAKFLYRNHLISQVPLLPTYVSDLSTPTVKVN